MIDALDSYYNYIAQQMAVVDPTQTLNGYIDARDWPLTPPSTTGGLYLLFIRAIQLPKGTESQNLFQYSCQWVWIIQGANIQPNQQAENRGARGRQSMKVAENLRQANFPGFCLKRTFSADAAGNVTSVPVTGQYPPNGTESIWWSRPKFMPRQDNQKSGLIYGAAAVDIFAYEDVALAVANSL